MMMVFQIFTWQFQEERDDIADQTVIQVFEKGYKFKEKVLRPASRLKLRK